MANQLFSISAELFFKVQNSEYFGGNGTVGYISVKFNEVQGVEMMSDEFIQQQIVFNAQMFEVKPEDITLISKDEYDASAEDEDNDDICECDLG